MVLIVLLSRQVLPTLLMLLIVLLTQEEAHGEVDSVERRSAWRSSGEETHEHDLAGGVRQNKDIHIHSGCWPGGAAQCKQSQACDRLLAHVALACPQLLAMGG